MSFDYDWVEAEHRFSQAMAGPAVPETRTSYARYLLNLNRFEQALSEIELAMREDPLNPIVRLNYIFCLQAAGRGNDAVAAAEKIVELNPSFFMAHLSLGVIHAFDGQFAAALASAESAYAQAPWNHRVIGLLAGVLTRLGDTARVYTLFEKMEQLQGPGLAGGHVVYHVVCGDLERAVDWIEKAIEERDPNALALLSHRKMWSRSPRWPALAKMLNLPADR
jgi:tetratricopeptide (TPR) repeat protein